MVFHIVNLQYVMYLFRSITSPYYAKVYFDAEVYGWSQSVSSKTQYLKELGLGGAMVWSIDTDDFHGFCTGKKFGIIATIREVLFDGHFPTGSPTTSPPMTSTSPMTSSNPRYCYCV